MKIMSQSTKKLSIIIVNGYSNEIFQSDVIYFPEKKQYFFIIINVFNQYKQQILH